MPRTNGKPPACEDFFNCSLPKDQQNTLHMQIYHQPDPVVIPNPCPHPECDYKSILRTNPLQHQKHCKFVLHDPKAARAPIEITSPQPTLARRQSWRDPHTANIVAPRQQTQPTRQPSQRQFRPTFHYADQPPSSSSSARLAADPFPPTGSTPNSNNTTASIVTQLLTTMDHIGNTVDRLSKQLDQNAKIVGRMSEQTEWVMDQVDKIRAQNASLEAHTESMRIDMGMTEEHLGALWKDAYKIKVALKGLREGD